MKDIFQHLYDGILRFKPIRKYFKFHSTHRGNFPAIGLLTDARKLELEEALGLKINKIEYFEQALIHRSYLQVLSNPDILSNERLEFLGDSILGMIVSDYLFSLHTNLPEGELTKMRSWLVNKKTLAMCAKKIGLEQFLMLSYSAEKSLKSGSDSILADALESVLAAVYLDSGLDSAASFVINSLLPIMMSKNVMTDTNYKSILLESVQAEGKGAPVYEVMEESGPDHEKEFTVGVYVDNELLAVGMGKSKKQAEQFAARKALDEYLDYNKNN